MILTDFQYRSSYFYCYIYPVQRYTLHQCKVYVAPLLSYGNQIPLRNCNDRFHVALHENDHFLTQRFASHARFRRACSSALALQTSIASFVFLSVPEEHSANKVDHPLMINNFTHNLSTVNIFSSANFNNVQFFSQLNWPWRLFTRRHHGSVPLQR